MKRARRTWTQDDVGVGIEDEDLIGPKMLVSECDG